MIVFCLIHSLLVYGFSCSHPLLPQGRLLACNLRQDSRPQSIDTKEKAKKWLREHQGVENMDFFVCWNRTRIGLTDDIILGLRSVLEDLAERLNSGKITTEEVDDLELALVIFEEGNSSKAPLKALESIVQSKGSVEIRARALELLAQNRPDHELVQRSIGSHEDSLRAVAVLYLSVSTDPGLQKQVEDLLARSKELSGTITAQCLEQVAQWRTEKKSWAETKSFDERAKLFLDRASILGPMLCLARDPRGKWWLERVNKLNAGNRDAIIRHLISNTNTLTDELDRNSRGKEAHEKNELRQKYLLVLVVLKAKLPPRLGRLIRQMGLVEEE